MLTFKGMPFENGTKKADLSWLLSLEMKDSFAQPFVAATSNGCAGTSGDAGDADAGEGPRALAVTRRARSGPIARQMTID